MFGAFRFVWITALFTGLWSIVTPALQEIVKSRLVDLGQRSAEVTVCTADSAERMHIHRGGHPADPAATLAGMPVARHYMATIRNNGREHLDNFRAELALGVGPSKIDTYDFKVGINSLAAVDKFSVKAVGNLYHISADKLLPNEAISIDGWVLSPQGSSPLIDVRADNLSKTSSYVTDCWPRWQEIVSLFTSDNVENYYVDRAQFLTLARDRADIAPLSSSNP